MLSSRTALIAIGYMALALSPAFAQSAELICNGEAGPLLQVGQQGENRLELSEPTGERLLEMEHWSICFRCAGFPRLDIKLKDVNAEKGGAQILAEAWRCTDSTAPETSTPETYCIAKAGIRVGNKDTQKCSFPKGTTLAVLWTALTRSPPPNKVELWWSFPQ